MQQLWQNAEKMSFWFRNCCVCRWSVPPVHWLCPRCWQKLKSFYLHPRDMIREQGGWTHARLFDWGEENDFFARMFLNSLKKGGPSFIFERLAQDFLQRFLQVRDLNPRDRKPAGYEKGASFEAVPTSKANKKLENSNKASLLVNTLFIPAPSSGVVQLTDHAFSFCYALSQTAGIALQNPLLVSHKVSIKQTSQKQKNKKERREIHFELKEPFLAGDKTIIFVDDILTTGATAHSAWKALGQPQKFIIFTLSWRRFLQKTSLSSQLKSGVL